MSVEKFTNSFWKLQIIGWLIYFVLMFLTFITQNTDETWVEVFFIKVQRSLTGFTLTSLLWILYKRIVNRYSIGKTVSIAFAASIIFGIIWTAIETLYFWLTLLDYTITRSLPYKPRAALIYAVTIMAWSAIYFGVEYWRQLQTEKENALKAKVLAEKAQLEMLRYQVNPHFLFNAMNSIRASIDEDKLRAKQMVTQLSEFLRHSLLNGETKEVPLRDELEAIRNYLAIEKIRFEDDLEIEFDIGEDAMDFKIPGFLLNPLVENSIKHGFQTSPKPLKIRIKANLNGKKLMLEVANTGHLNDRVDNNGTKIGLKNVRKRLEKLFPNSSSFELRTDKELVTAKVIIEK
ncbi:MAG: histidine kinase [Pyrinomonadaceae bacterium]|nr:histidine kinase [Pyrinomonadaceae bacterium]